MIGVDPVCQVPQMNYAGGELLPAPGPRTWGLIDVEASVHACPPPWLEHQACSGLIAGRENMVALNLQVNQVSSL